MDIPAMYMLHTYNVEQYGQVKSIAFDDQLDWNI